MPRVSIVLVVVAATIVGFFLILLAGSGKILSPASSGAAHGDGTPDLAWVRGYGVEGFERMLLSLFGEMGFNAERSDRGKGTVDFYAVDPTPIKGGRIYVRGVFDTDLTPLDAEEVITLIDTARAESVGKAVLVTLGRFSDEARDTAKDNPVDLVDGAALATLVRKHLPQAYATRTV
jgi:restriction endonuclease Mrr